MIHTRSLCKELRSDKKSMMMFKEWLVKRRWIVITLTLGIISVAISAYLMYREIYRPKKPNTILATYGYLFRDNIEELDSVMQKQERLPVNESHTSSSDTCSVSCPGKNSSTNHYFNGRGRPDSNETYNEIEDEPRTAASTIQYSLHGCCKSYQKHISPNKMMEALEGNMLHIVQFKKKRQYFLTDMCEHDKTCNRGCTCKQQYVTAVALVVDDNGKNEDIDVADDDKYNENNVRLEVVKFPGWCKCFND